MADKNREKIFYSSEISLGLIYAFTDEWLGSLPGLLTHTYATLHARQAFYDGLSMRYCPNLAGVRSILPCSGLIHETVRYIKLGCHQLMVTDGSIGFSESTAPSTRPCPVFSQ